MKVDVYNEIVFSTARSGGKGGQNVNKVETMVEGRWDVAASRHFSAEQKQLIVEKLYTRITSDGELLVRSQVARTQLGNKAEVARKINHFLEHALVKKAPRVATKPSRASKEKRVQSKKNKSAVKETRKRVRPDHY